MIEGRSGGGASRGGRSRRDHRWSTPGRSLRLARRSVEAGIRPVAVRDHATGGIRGGVIHAAGDRPGADPDRDGVFPGDLAATPLWRSGFDPAAEIPDLAGSPLRRADGEPLRHPFGARTWPLALAS